MSVNETSFATEYRRAADELMAAVASASPQGWLVSAGISARNAKNYADNIIEEKLATDLLASIQAVRPLILA